MMDLENLRRSYDEKSLDQQDLQACPFLQFADWFEEAENSESAEWFEVNAMTLATSDGAGRVSSRIVLLKKVTDEGFVFFTNYQSDKGQQIASCPMGSLVFYWPHVERQIRIEGSIERVSAELSDQYFHSRPRGSQLGAMASPQSQQLKSRDELIDVTMKLAEQYEQEEALPRPEHWGGYELIADRIEFWQGRPSRLHDRFVFTKDTSSQSGWNVGRLAP
ncbi:MAG: pyridoxamine 5'-phosphate oxidase [Planctomycetota bacterium]